MKRMQSFLWWCAGINNEIIYKTPTESSKYFGIGATIFFTGIFAALAAGYALITVFESTWIAIAFGILWGLMIFNLDRYIVSSMRKKSSRMNEFWMALPRFILAIIISIVIARPLELKIFEKEIESELIMMQQQDITIKEAAIQARYQPDNQLLKNEIAALENEISLKEEKRDALLRIAQAEADGTGGSKRRNAGPIYQIKKADADRVDKELEELKNYNRNLINQKLKKIHSNDSTIVANIASMQHVQLNGLASRIEAMDRLASKSEAIFIAHIFILLLFIAVETAPIIVKLIATKGPYDYLLQEEEYQHEAHHYKNKAKVNTNVKNDTKDLSDEERKYMEDQLRLSLHK